MVENIRVVCPTYSGTEKSGLLIATCTQSEANKIIPVGIVLFDDNTFGFVPIELIQKEAI